jgi:hypothetical protein
MKIKTKEMKGTGIFLVFAFLVCFFAACRKDYQLQQEGSKAGKPVRGTLPIHITMEEIYARLPQTVMYNLADKARFYVGKAQWIYTPEYLLVRIPTSEAGNTFLYAAKPYNNINATCVYAVQFIRDTGSNKEEGFSGRQMWLNFQDWTVYGIQYQNGDPVSGYTPLKLIDENWEACAFENGKVAFEDGKLQVGTPQGQIISGKDDSMKCPGEVNFWDSLWGFFGNILDGIGNLFSGIGSWLYDTFPDGGGNNNGPGSNWNGLPGGTPGGGGYGGGSGGYLPPAPGGGGGAGGSTPPATPPPPPLPPVNIWDLSHEETKLWASIDENPAAPEAAIPIWVGNEPVGSLSQQYVPENATVTFVVNILGLTNAERGWLLQHLDNAEKIRAFLLTYMPDLSFVQKKDIAHDHLKMMMENPDYKNIMDNYTGNWWDQDNNGFIFARKKQLEFYLQSNPDGLLDCHDLNLMPATMTQQVGSYLVPQSVQDRINNIRSSNAPTYTASNFKLQKIQDAMGGTVNCDYFYIKLYSMPILNNVQMSPEQFLEYFRTHFNDFIGPDVNVTFQPYIHYVGGTAIVNETNKFNSSYENSTGALVHIDMLDDGTVVQSGYTRSASHSRFMFSTMKTPLDYAHPVAGNRQFGIFSSTDGYYFYILGVDRTNDMSTTFVNYVMDIPFNAADNLWRSVQGRVIAFFDAHQGVTSFAEERIVRPKWNGPAKQFLLGQVSLAQMKALLHCP